MCEHVTAFQDKTTSKPENIPTFGSTSQRVHPRNLGANLLCISIVILVLNVVFSGNGNWGLPRRIVCVARGGKRREGNDPSKERDGV